MLIKSNNIVIRSADVYDAQVVQNWWNDKEVMKFVGFPNGIGINKSEVIDIILDNKSKSTQFCIVEIDGIRVGEVNYRVVEDGVQTGWKICDKHYRNKGYGTKIIILLFDYIFKRVVDKNGNLINKILWDTTLENKRAQHVYENKIKAKKVKVTENAWIDQVGNLKTNIDFEITREEFYSYHGETLKEYFKNEVKKEEIKEEEVSLRKLTEDDLEDMFKLNTKENLLEVKKWDGPYFNDEITIYENFDEFKNSDSAKFFLKENNNGIFLNHKLVGFVTRYWEDESTRWLKIGIEVLDNSLWSSGIGKIAISKWITKTFKEVKEIESIGLTTWSGNIRMMKVCEKLSMKKEAEFRRVRFYNDYYFDSISYGVLRGEWENR